MHLKDIYKPGKVGVSIEIFPPKEPSSDAALFRALEKLSKYKPEFISCTYGAGGSTRERTLDLCVQVQQQFKLPATAHFTCIGATRDELLEWLYLAQKNGIKNILALRGDPPQGETKFKKVEGGLEHANELVALIKDKLPDMGIGVAGYPETHLEAKSPEKDLEYLKQKTDAGADAVYTQLFFDNAKFFEFYERYQKAGIKVPLIPGIMPITDYSRIKKITSMCGTYLPNDLLNNLERVKEDKAEQLKVGVEHATKQCQELLDQGILGIHFYALNLSKATRGVLEGLKL